MTRLNRTTVQVEADRIDAELFRLAGRMKTFAKSVKSPLIAEAARRMLEGRGIVRAHMHRKDREET